MIIQASPATYSTHSFTSRSTQQKINPSRLALFPTRGISAAPHLPPDGPSSPRRPRPRAEPRHRLRSRIELAAAVVASAASTASTPFIACVGRAGTGQYIAMLGRTRQGIAGQVQGRVWRGRTGQGRAWQGNASRTRGHLRLLVILGPDVHLHLGDGLGAGDLGCGAGGGGGQAWLHIRIELTESWLGRSRLLPKCYTGRSQQIIINQQYHTHRRPCQEQSCPRCQTRSDSANPPSGNWRCAAPRACLPPPPANRLPW